MKKFNLSISMLLALLVIAGSLFAQQVKSDFDKNVDFTKFKTYTFLGWQEDSDNQLNDFDKERILSAFKKELEVRGLTKSDQNPDLGITLFLVISQEESVTAYTNYNGGYGYGGRWGWGMGYGGMGSSTTSYSKDDYLEGTLVIDFYDNNTKELVYQGILTKTVVENPKKRETSIPKAINKLMSKYPVKPMKGKK